MELIREELCKFMNDMKNPADNETIRLKAMDILEYIGGRKFKSPTNSAIQTFCLSKRQIGTFKNALKNIDDKQFLEAYWETFDFIHNYGSTENSIIDEGEYELFKFLIERIVSKIEE